MGLSSVLLYLIVSLRVSFSQGQFPDPGCSVESLPGTLWLKEGSPNGTVLLDLPVLELMELQRYSSPVHPPFIGLKERVLYLNDTFQLDNNKALCEEFLRQGLQWSVFLACKGQTNTHAFIINVNLTDNYPSEFTTNFSVKLQEMIKVGSEVLWVKSDQIRDRDCASNDPIGTSIFAIEAGNRDGSFAFPSPRSGRIVVNRWLDYEHGDRHFVLNLSISEISLPDRKSYATLEVTVTDIDDSDPVFEQQGYVLHVREEDPSSVGVWVSTDPPITVTDPDKNLTEPDPLIIALYDAKDASTLEVNSSTGQVKVLNTLDRELQPSLHVILKVQQTISSWRSSTVTLTVLVDDVNDNPPLFRQSVYDVTVDEHSLPGTSLVLVQATDADVGENANFTYVLLEGNSVFAVEQRQLGQDIYGLLMVKNSSQLDRETTPQINLTIGTMQAGAAGVAAKGCPADACQARVHVTLSDINDHSPVFDHASYVLHVSNDTAAAGHSSVLASVKATDADIGSNANITYTTKEFGPDVCYYATVDARNGDVILADGGALMEECFLIVTACDNPKQLWQRRCSTVPVQILPPEKNETEGDMAIIEASVPPLSLIRDKDFLESELGLILGAAVSIRRIRPTAEGNRSSVFISATSIPSQESLSSEKLQALLGTKREAIASVFQRYRSATTLSTDEGNKTDIDEEYDVFSPVLIALIVIVAVLLIAFIIAFVFVIKSRRRYKKQRHLLEKVSFTVNPQDVNADTSKPQSTIARNPRPTTANYNNSNRMASYTRDIIDAPPDVVTASLRSSDRRRAEDNDGHADTASLEEAGRFHRNGDAHGIRMSEVITRGWVEEEKKVTAIETDLGIGPDPSSGRRLEECDMLPRLYASEVSPFTASRLPGTGNTATTSIIDTNSGETAKGRDDFTPHEDANISSDFQPFNEREKDNAAQDNNDGPYWLHINPEVDNDELADFTASSFQMGSGQTATSLSSTQPPSSAEDSEDKLGASLAEDPEPDYDKKVRFSSHVVQLTNGDGQTNDDDVDESRGVEGFTYNQEENWNMHDETTAF